MLRNSKSLLAALALVVGWFGWVVLGLHVIINDANFVWFYELSYDPLAATILGGIPVGITVGMVNYVMMKRLTAAQHCPSCCPAK